MSIKLTYQLYEYVNKIDIKEFYDFELNTLNTFVKYKTIELLNFSEKLG